LIEGRCMCGAVRFRIARAVGPFELCHCTRCRRAHGTAFAAFLGVRTADYELLSGGGEMARYEAPVVETPPGYRTAFCRRCGSPVPDPPADGDWFEVPAGLLEGDSGVRPDRHIYVDLGAPWFEPGPGVAAFTRDEIRAFRARHGRGAGDEES
jgi:hypothetical protein